MSEQLKKPLIDVYKTIVKETEEKISNYCH